VKLVVFGANGATGRHLTNFAAREGHQVTAVTRRPDDFPIAHPNVRVAVADAFDRSAVTDAVAGHDAVVSILGVPYTKEPVTVLPKGTENIVAAMAEHGIDSGGKKKAAAAR
jgi:putative NADH-flavin reductase